MKTAGVINWVFSLLMPKRNDQKVSKKIISFLLIISVFIISFINLYSKDMYSYDQEAHTLYQLGLYKGISETSFIPDLGAGLDRQTGVCMLLRLFGLEKDAENIEYTDEVVGKFTDCKRISAWAKKSIAYAVRHGLVTGFPDGTFGPRKALEGKAYCTLILRGLGFTPNYNYAVDEFCEIGGLDLYQVIKFKSKKLNKDDLIGISYGALFSKCSDGKRLIDKLVDLNIVDINKAREAGLIGLPELETKPIPTNTPVPVNTLTAIPTVTPEIKPDLSTQNNNDSSSEETENEIPLPTLPNPDSGETEAADSGPIILYADISEEGDSLRVFFDTEMAECSGKQSQFKVFSSKGSVNVLETALVDEFAIVLTLDRKIGIDEEVKFSYTKGDLSTADNKLLDNISDYPVVNSDEY